MGLQVNHDYNTHLWCGIGALSAACGIPTSEAREVIKSVAMRKYIKAVTYSEMAHAITDVRTSPNREFMPRDWRECPTLQQWYDRLEPQHKDGGGRVFVICITGHWIVVKRGKWVCSMNHKERDMSDCPYLTSRVRHVMYFDVSKGDPLH